MSILDYHLQHVLFRILDGESSDVKHRLRNIRQCGRRLVQHSTNLPVVAVMRSDDGHSALFGHAHCRNPLCCPVCSAKIMEQYRAKIASAIDMQENSGFVGFMATFTVPHLGFMSCRETTDILYATWKYFRMRLKASKGRNWIHPYKRFTDATGVKSFVRVCEYTYGEKHGWHPHFHCIFWVPREHFDDVLEWEHELCEFWIQQARRVTMKYWRTNNLHGDQDLDKLLESVFAHADDWHQALYFSRDKNGKLLRAMSSDYITGWGSDREATGNCRKQASHAGHYTPYQILEMAERSPKWARVYIDFCLNVTRKPVHHRVNFSKDGICKRIDAWIEQHGMVSGVEVKKKSWAVVTYFNADEWCGIYSKNRTQPVIENILLLAKDPNNEQALFDYIESLGIPPRRRLKLNQFAPGRVEVIYDGEIIYVDEYTAELIFGWRTCTEIEGYYNIA